MADIVYPGQAAGEALNSGAMPANQNLAIYKGDYVELFIKIKDAGGFVIDLTGQTPKAQLKTGYDDPSPIDFECNLTGETGKVRVFLPSEVCSQLYSPSYIWDFQLTNPTGQTRTYLTGDVFVTEEVTT